MRPGTGGRWIGGMLIVGPMILVQLIYVVLIVQTGAEQAQHICATAMALRNIGCAPVLLDCWCARC